jgi:hypothetical protein
LELALEQDPLNVECATQLAVCYWSVESNEEALRQFRQAMELDENFWLASFVRANFHAREGKIFSCFARPLLGIGRGRPCPDFP